MATKEQIDTFVGYAHKVGQAGLTICSSGNLSWRIGEEVLISGTGSWVPELTPEKVSVCRLSDGQVLNGKNVNPLTPAEISDLDVYINGKK